MIHTNSNTNNFLYHGFAVILPSYSISELVSGTTVLLEKQTVAQLVMKIHALYGIGRSIAVFTKARHSILS
jgi:hypothetical protein